MTDTRELVDELRLIGCHENGDARCTCGIGQEAADIITALSERCRALEEEVQAERSLSGRLAGALEYIDDYALSYPDLGALSDVAQPAIQDHADARAALTSGGRG